MKMSGQDIEAMAAMSPAAAGAMVGLQMRDDEIAHLRALVEEMSAILGVTADRLEAWIDGEKAAQIAAEQRQDRHGAEGHWNAIKNYALLAKQARAALAKAKGE